MADVTLGDLDFGESAAESDQRLFDYFVVTPTANSIVTRRVGLVLGRKGSGKTAIFRLAETLLERHGMTEVSVIRLNMDDHAWAAFKDFKNLGLSEEHAATSSWHLALLLQLAANIVADTKANWSRQAKSDIAVLRRFIEDNFGEISPQLSKSSKLIGQVNSLKVGAFGAGIEASFAAPGSAPRELAPALTDALSQHLIAPLQDSAWLLLLDQLDETWDGSAEKKALLVGLMKAVKRVNDDFDWRRDPVRGARAVAFLRTDIHEALQFDDKDKHRDMAVEISWTHEQLREMLQTRLGSDVPVSTLFETEATRRKGRIPHGSFNYLVSRTFMRPRDLIQFLTLIRNTAPDNGRITREVVDKTEPTYSRAKVDDLRNEYRRAAPWVADALDALKQGPNKFESRLELEERLAEKIDVDHLKAIGGRSIQELIDWMIEVSILGAALRKTATETTRFRCEGDDVSLEGDSTAWVHPALFRGLSLYEPRAAR